MELSDMKLSSHTMKRILKEFKDHPKLSNCQDEVPSNIPDYTDKITKELLEKMTQISNPLPGIEGFATYLDEHLLIVVFEKKEFSKIRVI